MSITGMAAGRPAVVPVDCSYCRTDRVMVASCWPSSNPLGPASETFSDFMMLSSALAIASRAWAASFFGVPFSRSN